MMGISVGLALNITLCFSSRGQGIPGPPGRPGLQGATGIKVSTEDLMYSCGVGLEIAC